MMRALIWLLDTFFRFKLTGHDPIRHPRLMFVNRFEIEIPLNFTLDACPRVAFGKNGGWHSSVTDANFHSGLMRGEKYIAEVYRLKCVENSKSLAKIAEEEKRILPGALGGAVLISLYGRQLPKDRWVICLDVPEHLHHGWNDLKLPYFCWQDDGWYFFLNFWRRGWSEGNYVVFFRSKHQTPWTKI